MVSLSPEREGESWMVAKVGNDSRNPGVGDEAFG